MLFLFTNFQVAGLLPYYVAIDHTHQEVILAVRGSFSMTDIMTDTLWRPVNLSEALTGASRGEAPVAAHISENDSQVTKLVISINIAVLSVCCKALVFDVALLMHIISDCRLVGQPDLPSWDLHVLCGHPPPSRSAPSSFGCL